MFSEPRREDYTISTGDHVADERVSAETACEILHKALPRKRQGCGRQSIAIRLPRSGPGARAHRRNEGTAPVTVVQTYLNVPPPAAHSGPTRPRPATARSKDDRRRPTRGGLRRTAAPTVCRGQADIPAGRPVSSSCPEADDRCAAVCSGVARPPTALNRRSGHPCPRVAITLRHGPWLLPARQIRFRSARRSPNAGQYARHPDPDILAAFAHRLNLNAIAGGQP